MSFKNTLSQLRVDLKTMTLGEKIDHIWSSFKEWILIVGGLSLLVIVYLVSLLTAKDAVFAGYTLNAELNEAGKHYVTQEYLHALGGGSGQEINLASGTYMGGDQSQYAQSDYAIATQIGAMVSAQSLDFFLTDQSGLDLCVNMKLFIDLRDLLPEDQLKALGNQVIYRKQDSGREVPVAIRLTDTVFAKECMKYPGELYVIFVGNTQRNEEARGFLTHLLDYRK